ncbi:lantibiotic dehydratase family protein [Tenacibaculum sp. M341]|uniref:lantibiotic dehydratase family protein n=1 Tax=Tenacibaculum sp. M341 TaxID=2530339 RepID=UPI00104B98D4|nr:lantibiotic dehydratase family protein [Tenacibaculum sp. M341]TCI93179.1 hypothetical protein EYW44_06055 [Tenacibaculum sp. M341]
MKKNKNPYRFKEKYCLRTPALSLDFCNDIFTNEENFFENLQLSWNNIFLQEAIFLASPYLFNELFNFLKKKEFSAIQNEKLYQTFLKYVIRSSTRCTPFGLFAGVSYGNFDKETEIELVSAEKHKRITKYDTNYIASLLNYIFQNEIIKDKLLFYPNSTLYKVADQYRYIEYLIENLKRSYSVESIESNIYIEEIINSAKEGKTIQQLAELIVNNDISIEDAKAFVLTLIENQILVSEFELNVTGDDPLNSLIEKISSIHNAEDILSPLLLLQSHLTDIDKKIGNESSIYSECFSAIEKLNIPYDQKYVFQTDLFTQTSTNKLSVKHAYTVKNTLPLLNKLSPLKENSNLQNFKRAFISRYETREMPLAKVLDVELGIGYIQHTAISDTTPFLDDIIPSPKTILEETLVWSEIDEIIYQKLLDTEKNNDYVLTLKDQDFKHIEVNWKNTPDTLSAQTQVLKIDGKECLYIKGVSANAGNLIGRFSYENSDLIRQITNLEQQMEPDKIIAEIVHLPKARIGNILKRSHLRDFEIPYLAKSTLALSRQITIDDLFISIRKNKIILTSKKHNKEVIPRLTNAHNYSVNALPIYHFLCDLQLQNTQRYFSFSWPKITTKHPFLPRVIYNKTILSKAKWNLKENDIQKLYLNYSNKKLLIESISRWRKRFHVPKYVQLVQSDNLLLVNLENFNSIQLLLNTIKNQKKCLLEEFLFTEDTVVNRGSKKFTNECMITLYNHDKLNL